MEQLAIAPNDDDLLGDLNPAQREAAAPHGGRLLRREAPKLGYASSFTIYDAGDSERLIAHILKEVTLGAARFKPSQVHHMIYRAKDELLGPEAFEASTAWDKRAVAPVYREYQRALKEANALD